MHPGAGGLEGGIGACADAEVQWRAGAGGLDADEGGIGDEKGVRRGGEQLARADHDEITSAIGPHADLQPASVPSARGFGGLFLRLGIVELRQLLFPLGRSVRAPRGVIELYQTPKDYL